MGTTEAYHRAIYVNLFPKTLKTAWRSTVVRRCIWDGRFFGVNAPPSCEVT